MLDDLLFGWQVVSKVDWRDIFDRAIGVRVRAAQHTRAHVVSGLNAVLPQDRPRWTTLSLFTFIAAFTVVEHKKFAVTKTVAWLRTPEEIVGLLLRGTTATPDQRAELEAMLISECSEVYDTLPLMAPQNTEAPQESVPGTLKATAKLHGGENGSRTSSLWKNARHLLAPVVDSAAKAAWFGRQTVGAALQTAEDKKRRMRERTIVELFAKTLLDGGLSTNECHKLLLSHGMDADDIRSILRA